MSRHRFNKMLKEERIIISLLKNELDLEAKMDLFYENKSNYKVTQSHALQGHLN